MIYGSNVAVTSDRFNNPNSALDFKSGYNTVPSGVYFNGDFTFTVWINYNENRAWATILEFSNYQTDVVGLHASYSNLGTPGMVLIVGSGTSTDTLFTSALQTGRWYHVAYEVCGTTGKVYVDGQLKVSGTQVRPSNVNRTTNFIGGNNYAHANLNAKLDELRLYNRCMSKKEIMNLMSFSNTSPDM